jgi:hypothetical protein
VAACPSCWPWKSQSKRVGILQQTCGWFT